jgi:hypothetical protein
MTQYSPISTAPTGILHADNAPAHGDMESVLVER